MNASPLPDSFDRVVGPTATASGSGTRSGAPKPQCVTHVVTAGGFAHSLIEDPKVAAFMKREAFETDGAARATRCIADVLENRRRTP